MGEDYVSILQRRFIGMMNDAEMGVMEEMFPVNIPQAKKSFTIGRSTNFFREAGEGNAMSLDCEGKHTHGTP